MPSKRHKHRFARSERMSRITRRIQKAGRRGISPKQIASQERLSRSRTDHYLSQIRKQKSAHIGQLGKKFYYTELPGRKKSRTTRPRTQEPESPRLNEQKKRVELRGYINYSSSRYRSADIDIDCVTLIEHDNAAIAAGIRQITSIVERRFGPKLARMLKFGVSPATPESANHFLCRRHGGNWIAF
jgi:hypothetical protein